MRLPVPAVASALMAAVALSAAPMISAAESAQAGLRGRTAPAATVAKTTPAATAAPTIRVAPGGGFAWPLSPDPGVRRRFQQPQNRWSHGHRGVDLSAVVGQPVLSAGEGVVAFSGVIAGRGVIGVRHAGGLRTTYDPVDMRLASGAVVGKGDRIGVVAPGPGHCAPLTCLHWGAISPPTTRDQRTYRDPLSLVGFFRPILLPLG